MIRVSRVTRIIYQNLQSKLFDLQKKVQSDQRANAQSSSEYFNVRARFIFILRFMYMLSHRESKSTTRSYVLLSINMVSTLNFEYDIKRSINAKYKYQKLFFF